MTRIPISITVSTPVHAWFLSIPKGRRSEAVDHALMSYIAQRRPRELHEDRVSRTKEHVQGVLDRLESIAKEKDEQ